MAIITSGLDRLVNLAGIYQVREIDVNEFGGLIAKNKDSLFSCITNQDDASFVYAISGVQIDMGEIRLNALQGETILIIRRRIEIKNKIPQPNNYAFAVAVFSEKP